MIAEYLEKESKGPWKAHSELGEIKSTETIALVEVPLYHDMGSWRPATDWGSYDTPPGPLLWDTKVKTLAGTLCQNSSNPSWMRSCLL